ncbi:hypothetical protein CC86DRAFT_400532 [Ophiobolus disseminans]|uniref:Uncharacterized protein n=1 Tax=Ophiobolus disseminans TaxID=1469910 RepID=A0A6A7ALC0_9PLEO|nr:hypothetical protein CC86DRAFT_400532 [Ophiobolus disseminans]
MTEETSRRVYTEEENIVRLLLPNFAPTLANVFKHRDITLIRLNDVSIQTFDIFTSWLLMEIDNSLIKEIGPWKRSENPAWLNGPDCGSEWYWAEGGPLMWDDFESPVWEYGEAAVLMYIFAEAYGISRLQLDAIDRLVWCHYTAKDDKDNESVEEMGAPTYLNIPTIQIAYENTKRSSKLRELLVSGYIEFGDKSDDTLSELPKQFLVDILGRINLNKNMNWAVTDECYYHGHTNEEELDKCVVRVAMNGRRDYE